MVRYKLSIMLPHMTKALTRLLTELTKHEKTDKDVIKWIHNLFVHVFTLRLVVKTKNLAQNGLLEFYTSDQKKIMAKRAIIFHECQMYVDEINYVNVSLDVSVNWNHDNDKKYGLLSLILCDLLFLLLEVVNESIDKTNYYAGTLPEDIRNERKNMAYKLRDRLYKQGEIEELFQEYGGKFYKDFFENQAIQGEVISADGIILHAQKIQETSKRDTLGQFITNEKNNERKN